MVANSFCVYTEVGLTFLGYLNHIEPLENDIVMSNLLFMLITYYSVMTDTNE